MRKMVKITVCPLEGPAEVFEFSPDDKDLIARLMKLCWEKCVMHIVEYYDEPE